MTVFRTSLPADTVAARYADAYRRVGVAGVVEGHSADTAWAQTAPTVLGGPRGGGTYTARVVAYQRRDSTHYRTYVGVTRAPGDSVSDGGRLVGFCGDLGRAAQAQGVVAREPDGEEQLPVWRRRP